MNQPRNLMRYLQQGLPAARLERHLAEVVDAAANRIRQINQDTHPRLQVEVTQEQPLGRTIRISAINLWQTVFGSLSAAETGIDTAIGSSVASSRSLDRRSS